MIIIDCPQGEEQWFKEKLGKPSASNASKIITNEGKQSNQRTGYLYELAAERITGKTTKGYKDKNMEIGTERENESRAFYELLYDLDVSVVGLVYKDENRAICASPDGLIADSHGLEMKNPLPKTQIKYLLEGKLPSEYFSQVQFSLYVTGLKYWDFLSYVPDMPHFLIRVERDDKFLIALEFELNLFCLELEVITKKIRG